MERLNYKRLEEAKNTSYILEKAPEKILQFGEGNFLRGFVDYFIDILNEKTGFNGKIIVIQPLPTGLVETINEQEGLYTLYLRGIKKDEKIENKRIISSISKGINPYENPSKYIECAANKNLRYIISNTTEAGIQFVSTDCFEDRMPSTFPAKLTKLMYERYKRFGNEKGKGFILLPCELIDNNGDELKRCVQKYAEHWKLEEDFKCWMREENVFCNTLVDRIVTGYPHKEADQINNSNKYEDKLINTAELFGLWVIEGPAYLEEELPFKEAGLPISITGNYIPYKKRKVRILNGMHTSMALAAYLLGKNTVKECMEDKVLVEYIKELVYNEIIPVLDLEKEKLLQFTEQVFERFENPYIEHSLLSIALNSVSKWRVRVMPTMKEYVDMFQTLPKRIVFSFAALVCFYQEKIFENEKLINDQSVLEFHKEGVERFSLQEYARRFIGRVEFWGEDLTKYKGFVEQVIFYLEQIERQGMKKTLQELVNTI